jgi:hypothetical protein
MWYSVKSYFRDKWTVIPLVFAFSVLVAMISYGLKHIHSVGEGVLLRYTIIVGPSLRGEWWKLYYLPAIGGFIMVVHTIIGIFLHKKDKIFVRTLATSVVLFEIFVFVAFIFLIGINF